MLSEQKYEKIDLNTIINDIKIDLEVVIAQKQATINFEKLPVLIDWCTYFNLPTVL